jgi:hypothetical protein
MGAQRRGEDGALPPWNSNRMLDILTFILIQTHFVVYKE